MPSASNLNAHTGYLMRMVSNAVSQEFARRVAGQGVTVAEWVMLRSLYGDDATTPSALADKMGMTRGAISKLADRLIEKGLVVRSGNPDDKRAHLLSLSFAGTKKVPILASIADENDAAFFAALNGEEHASVRAALFNLIADHRLSAMPIA